MKFRRETLENGLEIIAECNDGAHSLGVGFLYAPARGTKRTKWPA